MKTIIFLVTMIVSAPYCMVYEVEKVVKKVKKDSTTFIRKLEVVNFFDDYLQYFNDYVTDTSNTSSLKTIAESYHLPTFQMTPGVPLKLVSSIEDLVKGVRGFLNQFIVEGVSSIKWEKLDIQMLTEKMAYVYTIVGHYKDNGDVFNKVGADYFVFKTDGVWKIATLILYSPEPYNNLKIKNEVYEAVFLNLKNYNDILSNDDIDSDYNPQVISATGKINVPAINISQAGDFVLFESKQQIIADRKSFIFSIKSKGATYINYDTVQIKMLSESTAISSNIASINTKDGVPLFKISVTYLFNRTADGWKIVFRTFHKPETILNLNPEKTS